MATTTTQCWVVINTTLIIFLGLVYIDQIDQFSRTCKLLNCKQLLDSYPLIMGVYSRSDLLEYQNSTASNARLPYTIWQNILALGIEKDYSQPTRRGVRAGHKVKQKVNAQDDTSPTIPDPNKDSHLNISLWNAQSIKNKTTTCSDYVIDHSVHALFLTETWLSKDSHQVAIGNLTPPGYNFINIPREGGDEHGGLGVLYRDSMKLQLQNSTFASQTFEHAIIFDNNRKLHFVLVYRPPPSTENGFTTSQFLDEFDEFLLYVNTLSGKIIMLGDFNVHVNNPSKYGVPRFLASLDGTGFQQHIEGPTHRAGNTLDLVLTHSDSNLVKNWNVGPRLSDHHIILCKLNVAKPAQQKQVTSTRKLRSIDSEAFCIDFNATLVSLGETSGNVNCAVKNFETAVNTTLDKHAPASKRTSSQRIRQPWYTSDIHVARRVRRKYEKKWRRTRLEVHHEQYADQNRLVNSMIQDSKKSYFHDKLSNADTKSTFKTVNTLLNNNNTILPNHDSLPNLCDEFATYFKEKVENIQEGLELEKCNIRGSVADSCNQSMVPNELSEFKMLAEDDVSKIINGFAAKSCLLDCIPTWYVKDNLTTFLPEITSIANMSLSTGVFPDPLKHAIVSPLIKKRSLDPNVLKNYRPVSNIKFTSKVIEKHVSNSITNHMQDNNLGEPLQSAYKAAHSTETALLKVKNDIMSYIYNQKGVFLVLLDLSAAFDTVPHDLLFDRMETEIGLKGRALEWLKSYFSGRTSSVCINGIQSKKCSLNYGLPQGSILGPLCFAIYIIPIGRIIRKHGISFHIYADDIQLYIDFDPSSPQSIASALSRLAACIQDIQLWMTCNLLKLNSDKTEFFVALSSYNKGRMPPVKLQVGKDVIEPSQSVRNLGVIFDTEMSMSGQVSALSRSVSFHLRNISQIRRYLDFETCHNVIRSLVLQRLDYGNILLVGSTASDIQRLQLLQNWAARLMFQVGRRDHVSPLLRKLHWLPMKQRIHFKVLCFVYKWFIGVSPSYLSSCLALYIPGHEGLRSATDTTRLQEHNTNSRCLLSAADKAFYFYGPCLWNQLPRSVRTATSLPGFKKALKTHLFSKI